MVENIPRKDSDERSRQEKVRERCKKRTEQRYLGQIYKQEKERDGPGVYLW